MSKVLTTSEVLELAQHLNIPSFEAHRTRLELDLQDLAHDICMATGLVCGDASFEGLVFAGLCVSFYLKTDYQNIPPAFDELGLDVDGDWELEPKKR